MLRSFRHTVVLSALVLALVAPTAFASPVQSYDLDFGVRASIEALFARLGDLFDDFSAAGPATAEPGMEATFEHALPVIPISGVADTGDDDENSTANSAETPDDATAQALPVIPISG